jgi:nucleoside-diphosphate-sugar epimerase
MNKLVLVTGANGFVGQSLCKQFEADELSIRCVVRTANHAHQGKTFFPVGDIGLNTDWSAALEGVEQVVHLASRAHITRESSTDPLGEYRRVNVEGTRRLVQQAIVAGVQRFVYVSSVKVNGEMTTDSPYQEDDNPEPEDAYGISKWEAEQVLWDVTQGTGCEAVVLRPPLMYGPGVKANFLRLMHAVQRGIPLPFAAVQNKRSLLYVDNLVDAIRVCLHHPQAAGQTFLVSDGEDVSTPELIRRIARALNRTARIVPVPMFLLQTGAALIGKTSAMNRLTGSLQINSHKIHQQLGWHPSFSMSQGLEETSRWFQS